MQFFISFFTFPYRIQKRAWLWRLQRKEVSCDIKEFAFTDCNLVLQARSLHKLIQGVETSQHVVVHLNGPLFIVIGFQ